MSFLNKFLNKSQRWVSLLFTGLIVTGALYVILRPLPPASKPKSPEEIVAVGKWTKLELFEYLARHQVYPDVYTDEKELVRLVKSIMNLYPDFD